MVVLEIAGNRAVGMVRAISDVVDDGALRQKLLSHPLMQRIELGCGEEAARHAGLVGEEEHEIAGVIQPADRLCRVRHPAKAILAADIAVVMIDDAVAVEEGGGLWIDGVHLRGGSRISACSISSQMPWATARWICWMIGVSSLGATRRWLQATPIAAPLVPVKPMVIRPCSWATRNAVRMFCERPEVESTSSTSPRRPRPAIWRANTCSKPQSLAIAVSAEVSVVSAMAA